MRGLYAIASLLPAALAFPWAPGQHESKAVYFLHNTNTSDNMLVSMPVSSDGSLGAPVLTSTNGVGQSAYTVITTPPGIFFSQSIVTVSRNYLFTVNAGSDTLVMFRINPNNPTYPEYVHSVSTSGYFPTSVAFSEALQMVCALNGGGKGSVSCFHVCDTGMESAGPVLPLDSAFNQTNPPTGPVDTVSQILFNPSSTSLTVIIKGNPTTKPPTPGLFLVYPISKGKVSSQGAMSQVDDLFLNFGSNFISDTELFIAAPTFGGAVLTLEKDGKYKQALKTKVKDEIAICWSSWNSKTKTGYLYDAGSTTVTAVDTNNGKIVGEIVASTPGNNGTQGGLYDSALLSHYSYSLADPNGIVALDLKTMKQIQYFDLTPYGTRENFEGMAAWPTYSY